MILERKSKLNVLEIKNQYSDLLAFLPKTKDGIDGIDELIALINLLNVYSGAMKEVSTKLEILNNEYQTRHAHNPIHHIERRVKDLRSLVRKMHRKDLPITSKAARENIYDIAGIRVVCNYKHDSHHLAEMLLQQEDIELVEKVDYINQPKTNGYRSLHLIVTVPVFLTSGVEKIPVEIQFRTIGMDMWASLEHKLNYKTNSSLDENALQELIECSDELSQIEDKMQRIFDQIYDESE